MRKAMSMTPLILVLLLGATALILSLRDNPDQGTSATPATENPAADTPTVKTDTTVSTVEPRPWPQEVSDIAADPNAVFGELDNGFRYLIYPNSEPPTRVSLRLHIAAGSLMEDEDQRGLAHFLEHMVFNGTKNFTAAELVPRMQRLGIAFGAHANAYTSFDETVYMLDPPDLSQETMDLCFTVMRDFGDGALLDPEEIDKERGVILAEKRTRDSVEYRLMEQQFEELMPDSLVSKRFPIGIEEVIESAPRERFVDFYTRYYTPERMTFIVVGDVEVDDMRKRITDAFSGLANPAEPGDDPDPGTIHQPEGIETAVFHDMEVSAMDVSLMLVRPHEREPDTRATRAERMPLEIAHSIISRRFDRISKEQDSPVADGSVYKTTWFNLLDFGSIGVTAADDRWREVVPVIEHEFRRAMQHGFTDAELAEAKANLLNAYEQQVKQKETRKSEGIATVLARTVNRDRVFSDPETDLDIAREILAGIDTAACHEALKEFWQAPGYHLVLTTKQEPENATLELAALFEDSRGTPVEPPAAREAQEFGYEDFGTPGEVAKRAEVTDMEISQLVLSNQVRVNLKRTDFERGKIRLLARVGSGKLTQPRDKPMLDLFAQAVFEGGGLGQHSVDELRQILAGRNVGSSLSIYDDAFLLSGTTTPGDFALQCRLMCASLTDPGYREEALWQFQKALPMLYQQLKHTPAGAQRDMDAWLHGNDPRFTTAPQEQLASYTIDDAKAWLTPELEKGYLELSIVGDFDEAAILAELLATFGALPERAAQPPAMGEARSIEFPEAPAEKHFTYESKIPQGIATVVWKTVGIRGNIPEFRRLNILGSILGDRMREEIREKLGASYSPNAGAAGSDGLDGVGYLIGESAGKPEELPVLLETIFNEAASLAKDGASEDELDRALKPTLGMLEKTLRDNSYWLGTVLSQSQSDPEKLELARQRDEDYRSISLGEINALAAKYLAAENALQVTIKAIE
ncbi:MAG TPA: insulinase family protein [Luteolibacter sp.]|nr:insulinase family protein [Luteolibacter sp.]